ALTRGGPRGAPRAQEVALQELDLIRDGLLEQLADVDVEVPARVAARLAARRPGGRLERGPRRRDHVLVEYAHEPWAGDLRGAADRPVRADAQRDPRSHLVAERHGGREEGAVAGLGVRAVHRGRRAG